MTPAETRTALVNTINALRTLRSEYRAAVVAGDDALAERIRDRGDALAVREMHLANALPYSVAQSVYRWAATGRAR